MGNFIFNKETGTMQLINSVDIVSNGKIVDEKKETASVGDMVPRVAPVDINVNEGIVQFREISDKTVYEICDKDTGKTLGYISGYALDMSFKTNELNSATKIEQFLNGIKSLFRNLLMENLLNK